MVNADEFTFCNFHSRQKFAEDFRQKFVSYSSIIFFAHIFLVSPAQSVWTADFGTGASLPTRKREPVLLEVHLARQQLWDLDLRKLTGTRKK